MLPQVVVLIAGGAFIGPLVTRVGLDKAAWLSAGAVVCGLAVYGLLGRFGYVWVALALVLVVAGMRVAGGSGSRAGARGVPSPRCTLYGRPRVHPVVPGPGPGTKTLPKPFDD
ncbi:hypothetical protein ACFYQ5_31380 [Streptomyces sp. NPDC005794]|uniref:hypothetical protein n=1 Tax=Streptomyces sp. NPDC005794 TaxID=3364733 RepID=UPI0036B05458